MKEKKPGKPEFPKKFDGFSQYRPPLSFDLLGRSFTCVMDSGYDYVLKFTDEKKLSFKEAGKRAKSYAYECLKCDDRTYFVNFELTGSNPRCGLSVVLDLEQDLTTFVFAWTGLNPKLPKLPSTSIVFGAVLKEDGTLAERRHGYTADLTGLAIHWYYSTMEVVHVYTSERYYRIALPQSFLDKMAAKGTPIEDGGPSLVHFFEEPANYVKIKDGIYLLSFVEEQMHRELGAGGSMLYLMDLNRMHDVGRGFGIGFDGRPENYTFGAFGEPVEHELMDKPSYYWIR
ncbi:MAG: MoaF N-terminal domain-containing protein [Eubacterium sp.]|nr:MoaF N-terminal domain-containing protein [Eubacterium sp.]